MLSTESCALISASSCTSRNSSVYCCTSARSASLVSSYSSSSSSSTPIPPACMRWLCRRFASRRCAMRSSTRSRCSRRMATITSLAAWLPSIRLSSVSSGMQPACTEALENADIPCWLLPPFPFATAGSASIIAFRMALVGLASKAMSCEVRRVIAAFVRRVVRGDGGTAVGVVCVECTASLGEASRALHSGVLSSAPLCFVLLSLLLLLL